MYCVLETLHVIYTIICKNYHLLVAGPPTKLVLGQSLGL